jgi:DNA ligase-1
MRGGIKEGLFKKALSKFYDIDEKDFNEIFLKSGSFKNLIENFRKGEFKIEVLKPIPMMLAEKVENFEEFFSENKKKIAIEYKYDGIRVQIHKKGDSVKIFSRNLNDITEKIPSIVLKTKDNLKDINEII